MYTQNYIIYLADDAESQSGKLILHWNLCLAISKRPEPLQKLVHTLIEGGNQTFEIASILDRHSKHFKIHHESRVIYLFLKAGS